MIQFLFLLLHHQQNHETMRKIFVTMLLVSICQLLSAQTYSLSGVVRNQDGEPVAGAKIGIVDLNTFYKYEQDMFDILEVRGDTVCIAAMMQRIAN